MDDAQLLRSFVEENSSDAFQRLVARHIDLVYSAALRRTGGDPHRAGEITQMVFTDLARKSRSLLRHPLLPAWLHQATRWSAATLRRSEQRRIHHESLAASDPALGFAAEKETSADWSSLQPILDDALDSLNDTDRAAILQRFFQQQPFATIAARLGVSENTARMRVDRALEKLRNRLARHGLTSTSAALGLALAQHSVTAAPAHLASTLSTLAIATAANTTATTALTAFFMTKLQLSLASAAVVALATGFIWQHRENARLDARLTSVRAANLASASLIPTLENDLAAHSDALRSLNEAFATTTVTLPPLTPEQQQRHSLDTIIRKGELDNDYALLFQRLDLSPEQLDTFKILLVERNQAINDATRLAKTSGLDFASHAELRSLADAVTASIDQRIAFQCGRQTLEALRDYLALDPYRRVAVGFLHSGANFEEQFAQESVARVDKVARILLETAPNYPDVLLRSSAWPVDFPESFEQALLKHLPPEDHGVFIRRAEAIKTQRRLYEIARDAALAGKLKTLSKSSARDYAPTATIPATP